ncbi:Methyltransferase domain-containing protein [Anaerocolumna jejuensis DSM 15929]|uniref:Methyltransferase domain-containing protein n=1 Tax=Anaerocolumna jejuensis DSM 15929 TaxID=1121322 RepID=A0A1M7C2A5_9FIRM|nr:class I SAM-dependent methyltransferase [Anaerocolumna jejuensis]SHL61293.1 Methyltransferase domain-containing protein [Anaerocolumna jejuensis DSM 15929]
MDSIDYYNKNANLYFENTVNSNTEENREKFLAALTEGSAILDLGCGSGRDSLEFIQRGFDVTAVDGAEELCELASIHIGQDVLCMQFEELDFDEVFDGIWANASLLHILPDEFDEIFKKVIKSLKPQGILYMSFGHGDFTGYRNGRYFKDFKTKAMKELLSGYEELELLDIWKSTDDLGEASLDEWLHVLVKKGEEKQE